MKNVFNIAFLLLSFVALSQSKLSKEQATKKSLEMMKSIGVYTLEPNGGKSNGKEMMVVTKGNSASRKVILKNSQLNFK